MSWRHSRAVAAALVAFTTFTDLLAYSVAVPVLPDLTTRLGASPEVIGFLFASFGVTLIAVAIPMGIVSDRVGRRGPLVAGMAILAVSTVCFAYATRLPWLFAARLMQGAADAIAWGVGFALVADLFGPSERGRVMGLVMSGSNLGFMLGPSIGGWLYEVGGARLPFQLVTGLAVAGGVGLLCLDVPPPVAARERVPFGTLVRHPAVAACALAVVTVSATFSMFEPVLALFLGTSLALSPARVGLVFGLAAVASASLHPLYGRLADRFGGGRLMVAGTVSASAMMPLLGRAETFGEALALYLLLAAALSMVVTPSLSFMAEAGARAGAASFGVSYGLYNFAWGCGLLVGPAAGGVLYQRVGFARTLIIWPVLTLASALWLGRSVWAPVPTMPTSEDRS